jgi:hypothetical protein
MDAGSETGGDSEVTTSPTEGPSVDSGSDEQAVERDGPGPEPMNGTRKPAVTRRDESPADDEDTPRVVSPSEPPEPQEIDAENAAFVLLGVVLVVGFIIVAVAGF